jgi:hypothetical protein
VCHVCVTTLMVALLVPADKSVKECNAVDMCMNWSPCYVSNPPKWVNGTVDIIL